MQNGEVLCVGHVEPCAPAVVVALDSSAEEIHNLGTILMFYTVNSNSAEAILVVALGVSL